MKKHKFMFVEPYGFYKNAYDVVEPIVGNNIARLILSYMFIPKKSYRVWSRPNCRANTYKIFHQKLVNEGHFDSHHDLQVFLSTADRNRVYLAQKYLHGIPQVINWTEYLCPGTKYSYHKTREYICDCCRGRAPGEKKYKLQTIICLKYVWNGLLWKTATYRHHSEYLDTPELERFKRDRGRILGEEPTGCIF